jgi:tetratricopeptide (TPR) repeat protein
VAAAAAVAAALLLGMVGTTIGMLRAEREAAGATAAYEFMNDLFAAASPVTRGGGRDARVADVLDAAADKVGERLRGHPEVEIKARRRLAASYSVLGLDKESAAVLRPALGLARQVHGAEGLVTLQVAAQLVGSLANGRFDLPQAEQLGRESLAAARRTLGEWHEVTRVIRFKLYECCRFQGRLTEAEELLREDLALRGKFGSDTAPAYTVCSLQNLGHLERHKGKLGEAEALAHELAEFRERHPTLPPETNHRPDELRAFVASARDDMEGADAAWANLLAYARHNFGGGHRVVGFWTERHAEVLAARGRFAEALPLRQELLELERSRPANGETVAERTLDVADLMWLTGERAGSDALRRRAAEAGGKPAATWRWRRAVLRPVLGDEAEWVNPSLFVHVWALADKLVADVTAGDDPAEDPAAAGFQLAVWDGAQARAVAGGTLAEARRVGKLPPGVYRMALDLPRRSAARLRGEAWVPLWTWRVERYELDRPDPARWREVRANHQAPRRELAALALGDGWTHYAGPGGQRQNFGIVATAEVDLPAGKYRLSATSDDGVCVGVDGRPLIDAWKPRRAAADEAVVGLEAGRHAWRVEYFNAAGEFKLWLQLAPEGGRTAGGAGG